MSKEKKITVNIKRSSPSLGKEPNFIESIVGAPYITFHSSKYPARITYRPGDWLSDAQVDEIHHETMIYNLVVSARQ
jgi:hypothetical protein